MLYDGAADIDCKDQLQGLGHNLDYSGISIFQAAVHLSALYLLLKQLVSDSKQVRSIF